MSLLRKHPVAALTALLIVVWTAELWFVQSRALVDPFKNPEALMLRYFWRLGLDVALVTLVALTLPARALHALFVLAFALFCLGGVYLDYYGRMPRLAVLSQSGEGASIAPLIVGMMPAGRTLALLGLLAVKVGLVHAIGRARGARAPGRLTRRVQLAALGTWLALVGIGHATFDPLTNMKRWGTIDRFGMTYGFTIPLVVEAYYARSQSLLQRAKERAEQSTDRLTPVEAPLPAERRVVLLQVESLDWGLLGHLHRGLEVTPNVNALARTSMVYKAEAAHFTGSADADFVAAMAVWPSPDIVTYKIDGYSFASALPHRLAAHGWTSHSFHGVSGTFFSRRDAFAKMGFGERQFREELAALGLPAKYEKYDWIQDAELLEHAAARLRESPPRTLHLVITVTSHSPFKQLPPGEATGCPPEGGIEDAYFCSMRYVDRALGRYFDAIPDGTTLVVYGDHNSSVESSSYRSGREGKRDYVPVLIHSRPGNLAALQRTRGGLADRGELTFVDVMRYVHTHVVRVAAGGK